MKLKGPLIIVSIIIVVIILFFTFSNSVMGNDFIDNGTSTNNNNNWDNHYLNVSRNNEYTTLSSKSNSSLWYTANHTVYDDFIVEWDNHGKPNMHDYCLISNKERTEDSALNFINNLNITKDCHVKLVIKDNTITPYVNDNVKDSVPLNTNPSKGMVFRFQINPNGSDINYSNFKMYSINQKFKIF